MSKIADFISSLRGMDLPKGAEALLSSIGAEADSLERSENTLKRALDKREEENKGYRDDIKQLKSERDGFKEKVPGDSSTILSKADGERWQAYTALGKVDEVKASLERVKTLEAGEQRREREQVIRSAGYDPKKIDRLTGGAALKLQGEGDAQKVLITLGDEEKDLGEWAEAEGIADLLNVARLEQGKPNGVPAAAQAGQRSNQPVNTWAQASDSRFGVKPKTT